MSFRSILFPDPAACAPAEPSAAPDCFVDLNLDQIVDAITAGKEEYDLQPFFHAPLHDIDAVAYRHEVMQALEDEILCDGIRAFANRMQAMRQHLAQSAKLHYAQQKQRWFLDAVDIYCDAVICLVHDLAVAHLTSRGLLAFRDYATRYAASERFVSLFTQTKAVEADLASIDYCVRINGATLQVRTYAGEPDYSADVEATFVRFKQGAVKDYQFSFSMSADMNHIEAKVVELVARLYPGIFAALATFCTIFADYPDSKLVTFDREIQFYVACLEHIDRFRKVGLDFCYPRIVQACREVYDYRGFDLALAGKLRGEGAIPVCNDFHLSGRERIIIVSGPNQGGKTTFARAFGQLHYLASLGCPVPGKEAQLFLFDRLLTHFEREEAINNLRGKLQDDLVRVHRILARATPDSIIIMNEIFTSTTLRDAIVLSRKIATKIIELDLLCVWVTFIDELASLGEQAVSMVGTVTPGSEAVRTYKIVRRPADGLSYAMSIAEKYRLTHDMIMQRVGA